MKQNKTICSVCIMDKSDPEITFDNYGVCNHCNRFESLKDSRLSLSNKEETLSKLIDKIKRRKNKDGYDCIIGVSGGVDSTYVAYILKKIGLNPIAIHFDNGWNSELATKNIELTLDKLNIDLYTYVIDWDFFKEIQKAFLLSSTPDGEVPTDHAINALLFNEAKKRNIKYIINGMNFITEGTKVNKWAYGHSDWKYIKSVVKKFSKIKSFKKYPHFSILTLLKNVLFNRLKIVSILNYIDYNKDEAMKTITDEIGWKYYGGKHYESIYTRFFQGYFLPLKFGIDKRRAHLSDLIRSGQEKRENALKIMNLDTYPDLKLKEEDLEFVKKKFDLTDEDFAEIIKMKNKSFEDYPNNELKISKLKNGLNWLRKNKYYTK